MAMRDPKEWAAEIIEGYRSDDYGRIGPNDIEPLIREAQEDGARGERERADRAEADAASLEEQAETDKADHNYGLDIMANAFKADVARLEAQVAALTERAARAEQEANEYSELLVETSSKLDDAEYERDEAVKALDIHKERADRAESELHRRKF